MILDDILTQKRKDLEELKTRLPLARLQKIAESRTTFIRRNFKQALQNHKKINIIAELKKASPSEGILRADFQPMRLGEIYEISGAAALSILTEPHFFMGRSSYLKTVRQVTSIPLLRKDFIFEKYQIFETAILEADAFLLISSLLTEEELRDFIKIGKDLGMDALVEVHTDEDLHKAIHAGAEIVGINNRNLRTLAVNPQAAERLIPHIPQGKVIVIESGLKNHDEILSYKSLGAHAFLIGTAFMKSSDIAQTFHKLLGRHSATLIEGTHGQS